MDDLRRRVASVFEGLREKEPARRDAHLVEDAKLSEWCRQKALELGLQNLGNRVVVTWNRRLRTAAGWARPTQWRIELNPKLSAFGEQEVWRTLRHELAHLVAQERVGRRRIQAHGREWRAACAELGIPGEKACHQLPFPKAKMRRNYLYVCPSCGLSVERVRKVRVATSCLACCRKYGDGRYNSKFRMIEKML